MRSLGNDPHRSGPLLLAALITASLVLMTLYFREGDAGPLHRTRSGLLAAVTPAVRAGRWVTAPIRWTGDRVAALGLSRTQIETLREQNAELRRANADLQEAALENARLRALVGFAEQERYDALAAHIIGKPAAPWEGAMTIDRGTDHGVVPGMPVVGSEGLLGQVVTVSARSARIRLITDQRSGVAAMVQRTRAEGVVRGSIEGLMTLDFTDRKNLPKVGDVVLTSGMGGVYPRGLPVGEVVEVEARSADLFPRIVVAPAVPVGRIEEVLVLRGGAPEVEGVDPE
ncbi:MAG: rod shape-determining protein MreC [Coriobacteriia bacterium]|nr:rod shape-determining protein MreC [Coriobacteriia bacterium]